MSNNYLKKLAGMGKEEWEKICCRCGRCCYEKLDVRGTIYYTSLACDQFDPQTKLCKVYDNRVQVRPDCMQLTPHVVAAGFLPEDCPYAAGIDDYKAPEMEGGDEL